MKSLLLRFAFIAGITIVGQHNSSAIESWADEKLPVRDGLEIWLDASKEIAARAFMESTNPVRKVGVGVPLDIWHDASGNKRHVQQLVPTSRPLFAQTPQGVALRFDGTNDFLIGSGFDQQLSETTVFIVAAPKANKGEFGSFLALARAGVNDYSHGLNIDMGTGAKQKFDHFNVEGTGFTGIQNLMTSPIAFGETRVLTLTAEAGTNACYLWIDGIPQERLGKPFPNRPKRPKSPAAAAKSDGRFGFEQITVGARFYSNNAEPPHVQGFFEGTIAEVLVYNRVLSDEERAEVEQYLKSKLISKIPGRTLAPLATPASSPAVQMFVPGFTARQLPVTLNNINCVKYREDGKLVALGYDGNIWLLVDSDGDGLEDKTIAFWNKPGLRSPIGMALTPPNYPKGRGVFVASKDRVALFVDTNNDDVADQEIIVANGWQESFHGVDALGCAIDKDGNVYFGLGTANFAGAYLIDKDGKSTYSLTGERSTILKVSPDFTKREVVCTGIRFPVALAINPLGDLFCTDQEGATWLPNGNPLDELLHIQPGRHYGFPPRHPKHLPNVIDEPSAFDYGPQHQSTCGLNFNSPVNGGKTFGPAWWRDDAFVAGYSRGKIYRTKLVKAEAGYIAQNQLIANVDMLPADQCVSPQGDLVITVHSGKPDWGSGPTGVGKLYKVSYDDKAAAQPVAIWPASPTETHIEFDRALDPTDLKDLAKQIVFTQGRYVSAGDQFEILRPGYQAVQNQLLEPRYALKVFSAGVSSDGRTLIIHTERRSEALNYAITLPRKEKTNSALPQHPTTDLAFDLTGVEAEWQNANGSEKWSGWLPHFDLTASHAFTGGSAAHEKFWRPGKVTLRGQLNLFEMLHSSTQPGSDKGFKYPDETVTVVLKSKSPMKVTAPSMKVGWLGDNHVRLTASPKENVWFPFEITLQNSEEAPSLDVSWFTIEDTRPRPLPLRRVLMPFATLERSTTQPVEQSIPEIAGGNWLRGKKIFFGEQAACSRCHLVNGDGAKIGPDLSNLIHRDYASVMKDILEPSAAINPDHIAYNVELNDGETMSGVLVGAGEAESKFADATGKITAIPKNQIKSVKPSTISLMPEGLLQHLSEQQRKDLLTYLLTTPLQPAPLEKSGEPAPRKKAELEAMLKVGSVAEKNQAKPLRIVLCGGPKDHGPGEHDYPLWQKRWSKLLALADDVVVETADKWPSTEQMSSAHVIVFYSNNPDWSPIRASELDSFLSRGGGAVYIHYAVDGHAHCDELAHRIGLAWKGGQSWFRHGSLDLKFNEHPITAGFKKANFIDESYWNLVGDSSRIQLLATGDEGGQPRPLLWAHEQGKGRVFVSIPGHYTWTFDDPLFRLLIFRGIAWTTREPLNRFDDLITVGARVVE